MKKIFLFIFVSVLCIFSCKMYAQVPAGVTPATGIPVLVPETFGPLTSGTRYCQLTRGGSSGSHSVNSCGAHHLPPEQMNIPGQPTSHSHTILNSGSNDTRACKSFGNSQIGWTPYNPPMYLNTYPAAIQDWNDSIDGELYVMKLGDEFSAVNGNHGSIYSSVADYFFSPTNEENVLLVYFAFVAQAPGHNVNQNPYFKIEVTDANGNYITTDPMHSTFMVNPPTTDNSGVATGAANSCAHDLGTRQNGCPGSSNTNPAIVWCDWMPIAFDLRNHVGSTIRLRIMVADCSPEYHYAYAYFTGRGIKGELDIQACGDDNVSISVPWGFKSYRWYINDTYVSDYDDMRTISRERNTSETEFSCEMVAYTDAPFVFNATVNYYELDPHFTYEQLFDDCSYKVQFTDSSTVSKINNGGNEVQEVQFVEWDFGDGSPVSHEINPLHVYDGPGPYTVKLTLFDNDNICDSTIVYEILLDTSAVATHYSADTIKTCEENLPYIYAPAILPEDEHPAWSTPGNYELTYPEASDNGCDSVARIRFDVETPIVTISSDIDYCDNFYTILNSNANTDDATYLWSNGETTPDIEVSAPGTYELTITDVSGCTAESFFVVPACKPYIVLPNAISPSDANGLNDCLSLTQGALVEKIEFYLFDRTGRQVFYTTEKGFQWCGKVNGKIYPNAIYQYILIVTDYNGIETMHKGHITTL